MRLRRCALTLIGITGLVVTTGCAAGLRHPDFTTRHPQIHSIAVMPPEVKVYKVTFQGDEMMYEVLSPIAQQATEELERALAKRGYEIRPLDLSEEVLKTQPELQSSLHTVRTLFNEHLEDDEQRWFRTMRKFTYSVGSEINVFADAADSDALVMMRCTGYKKTGGEIAKDIAQTLLIAVATLGNAFVMESPSITIIQLAVIDGDTGDLLWYIDNGQDAGFDIARSKTFRKSVRNLMSKFPKAIPTTPQPSGPPVAPLTPVTPPVAVPATP